MGHSAASATRLAGNALRVWTTPPELADRLCTLVLSHYVEGLGDRERNVCSPLTVLDPACGTGDLLLAMMRALDAFPLTGRDSSGQWGLNVCGVDVQEELVIVADRAMRLASGTQESIRITQGDSLVDRPGSSWQERYPGIMAGGGFDLIVGNPPYLRHEEIADPLGFMPPGEYKRLLRLSAVKRLPHIFGGTGERLDGRTDLAGYFLLLGLSLLGPGGVLGFVVSTALLDTHYGQQLLDLIEVSGYRIHVDPDRHRRFQAAVNTAILMVTRRAHRVEERTAPRQDRTQIPPETASRRGRAATERAFTIPTRPLRTLGRLRYPIKTGINAFFLPNQETIERFGIEDRFLQPYLKSPREVPALRIHPAQLTTRLLMCRPQDRYEVTSPGLARYVTWGEQQKTSAGIPWPLAPSVRRRQAWYALPQPSQADLLCPRFFFHRLFFVLTGQTVREDQTFYGLLLFDEYRLDSEVIAGLLNCSFTLLTVEQQGRSSLGEGARQYALRDTGEIPMPDVDLLDPESRDRIRRAFQALAVRPPLPIWEEMQQPDRLLLDEAIAAGFGLSSEDAGRCRQYVVQRVEERLVRAAGFGRISRTTGRHGS